MSLLLSWAGCGDDATPRVTQKEATSQACSYAFGPDFTRRVHTAASTAQEQGRCKLLGVQALETKVILRWEREGTRHQTVIWPASCAPPDATPIGAMAVRGLDLGCPNATASVRAFLSEPNVSPTPLRVGKDKVRGEAPPPTQRDVPRAGEAPSLTRTYIHAFLPVLWALWLLLGLWALWRCAWRPSWALSIITLLAIILRVVLAPGGAGDLFNNLSEAYHHEATLRDFGYHGRGYDGLLLVLFQVVSPSDQVVITCSFVFGVLTVPAIHAFARRLGFSPTVALTAALFLAVAPLHIRFSGAVSRPIPVLFLCLTGWAALLAYLEDRRLSDLLYACVALSLAPQFRPENIVLPGVGIALVVAWRFGASERRLPSRPLLAALAVQIAILALPVAGILERLASTPEWQTVANQSRPLFDPDHNVFLAAYYTPLIWPALAVFGLMRPPKGNRWLMAVLALTALTLTAIVCPADVVPNILSGRYQLIALPFYILIAAAAIPSNRWGTSLAVVAALLAWFPAGTINRKTTMDLEYTFLRHALALVPDGCTVITYTPQGGDVGLQPDLTNSLSAGRHHDWSNSPEIPARAPCVVYHWPASCASPAMGQHKALHHAMCVALPGRVTGTLMEKELINDPILGQPYHGRTVRVGLYWLKRKHPEARPEQPHKARP